MLANAIQITGLVGWVHILLESIDRWMGTRGWTLGVPVWVLTIMIACGIFIAASFRLLVRDARDAVESADGERDDALTQADDARRHAAMEMEINKERLSGLYEAELRAKDELIEWQRTLLNQSEEKLMPRAAQRTAFEAMKVVYGYWVTRMSMHYTIYGGSSNKTRAGHAELLTEIGIRCMRPVSEWATMSSSMSGDRRVESPIINAEKQIKLRGRDDKLSPQIDIYDISPPIAPNDGEVSLTIRTSYNSQAFLIELPNQLNRPYDWVSFKPYLPVEELILTIEFNGFKPRSFVCHVTHGAGDLGLTRETIDANDVIVQDRNGGHPRVTLRLKYPVLGAKYELRYSLSAAPLEIQALHVSQPRSSADGAPTVEPGAHAALPAPSEKRQSGS